jgi:hypothetical protein
VIEYVWEKVTGRPYWTVRVMSEEFGPPLTVTYRALLDQVSDRAWFLAQEAHLFDFIRRLQRESVLPVSRELVAYEPEPAVVSARQLVHAAAGMDLHSAILAIRAVSGLGRRELPSSAERVG